MDGNQSQTTDRDTLIRYLPGIFQDDSDLQRFLQPFEETIADFESVLAEVDRYFRPIDPTGGDWQTEAEFLPWLASWVALVLDPEWDVAKRRQLISEATELYRKRGTKAGLKRYLEIYAGRMPEIRESVWPAGMQIGLASRIGGFAPLPDRPQIYGVKSRRQPLEMDDYYVIDAEMDSDIELPDKIEYSPGEQLRYLFPADQVTAVVLGDDQVSIVYEDASGDEHEMTLEKLIGITRRDKLIDELYQLEYFSGDWTEDPDVPPENLKLEGELAYSGDTLLVGEAYRPYCFIVDVKIPRSQLQPAEGSTSLDEEVRKVIEKVRAIVELEKPAHTLYYLKLTPVDDAL